jgi:hypothetical protein
MSENTRLRADVEERRAAAVHSVRLMRRSQRHELRRVAERQRPNRHRVDHAEDRAVDPDAERETGNGERREPRVLDQGAGGIPQVLEEGIHLAVRRSGETEVR